MAFESVCPDLRSFFMTEGRKLVERWMTGETVDARIANASIALGVPFNSCWRAYQKRCGSVLFPVLYEAEQAALAQQEDEASPAKVLARLAEQEGRTAQVVERLDRLEQKIDALFDILAGIPGDPADLGGGCERVGRAVVRERKPGASPESTIARSA